MKKKFYALTLIISFLFSGCGQTPSDPEVESMHVEITTTESSFVTEQTESYSQTVTEESSTLEETSATEETTAPTLIPEGEHIYPFSYDMDSEEESYFELEYHENGEQTIKKISFYVPQSGEMRRAWFFAFTQRTDFLFVRRTDRKTGGHRFIYVYETYDTFVTDGEEYEEFRAASSALFFTPELGDLVHFENNYRTDIGYNEKRKASQLARFRNPYLNHCYTAQMNFEFDRETYQYDILYGYVDDVEYIQKEDVESLPEVPFYLPSEYGADRYW